MRLLNLENSDEKLLHELVCIVIAGIKLICWLSFLEKHVSSVLSKQIFSPEAKKMTQKKKRKRQQFA